MKMEAVEEAIVHLPSFENVKNSEISDNDTPLTSVAEEIQKTNGTTEDTGTAEQPHVNIGESEEPVVTEINQSDKDSINDTTDEPLILKLETEDLQCVSKVNEDVPIVDVPTVDQPNVDEHIESEPKGITLFAEPTETHSTIETTTLVDGVISNELETNEIKEPTFAISISTSTNSESVHFETEVLIEQEEVVSTTEDLLINSSNDKNVNDDTDATNKILSQLEGQSIDLSEALRSTNDETENCENNNEFNKHQVLNKEELLDILEGKDAEDSADEKLKFEEELALQQLTQLKNRKKSRRFSNRNKINIKTEPCRKHSKKPLQNEVHQALSGNNIVKVLVKDWEEEEIDAEDVDSSKSIEQSSINKNDETLDHTSIDSSYDQNDRNSTETSHAKNTDDSLSHRRAGRVIKKKVIFDPDNPATYTKSKSSKIKQFQNDGEQSPTKRNKVDTNIQRSTSKSPVSKTLWKKPQPKSKNSNKRLSEVDKLLMDEGAVNMIYQLTPEASKGKKNIKNKAAFIKKINQSSTPEAKEMKFRERRKDLPRSDEPEAKKILGNKRSSIKSISDDFDANRADDSIIYRRHSSSSYSSTCMSPRRLSDVDINSVPNSKITQSNADSKDSLEKVEVEIGDQITDVFMAEDANVSEIIDKKVCLNIKEKLNSKLSRVLNMKRKIESKVDKPSKPRKCSKITDEQSEVMPSFEKLSVSINNKVAEINVQQTGSQNNIYNVETLKELQTAFNYVNNRKDVSITLFISECGRLCAGLDLRMLLNTNIEERRQEALEIAESVRSFLQAVEHHNKLLVAGVAGPCEGLALIILSLCDIAVVSEHSTFALTPQKNTPIIPGITVLTTHSSFIPQALVQEMLIFGRQLSASEMLQRGLVSRTLWPDRFTPELRAMVNEIALQPIQNLIFKKKILKLKSPEARSTFLSCLEAEKDLLVEHWTSAEGQETLRTYYTGSV